VHDYAIISPEPELGNHNSVELARLQLCKHSQNKLALLKLHYIRNYITLLFTF